MPKKPILLYEGKNPLSREVKYVIIDTSGPLGIVTDLVNNISSRPEYSSHYQALTPKEIRERYTIRKMETPKIPEIASGLLEELLRAA